jgi:hypothetical protein
MAAVTEEEAAASTVAAAASTVAAEASTVAAEASMAVVGFMEAAAAFAADQADSTVDRQECVGAQAAISMAVLASEAWADVLQRHAILAELEMDRRWAGAGATVRRLAEAGPGAG